MTQFKMSKKQEKNIQMKPDRDNNMHKHISLKRNERIPFSN